MASVLVVTAVCWTTVSSAQTTYSVFPARSVDADTQGQPAPPNHRVTVTVQDSTVAYIVREVLRQVGWKPVYINDATLPAKRISVNFVAVDAMDALGVVLKGTGLTAKLVSEGGPVVIRMNARSTGALQQAIGGVVTGRVTDSASGQGLGGASIKVEGTRLSSVTSDSGNFTLKEVPAGDQVLSVRLFGYKPVEQTVTVVDSERTTARIVLVPVPTVLSGVVTTATGLQRKVEVGNDITTLNVDSIMQVAPITSVTDLLETRVPGMTVMHTDGVPGDPSRIRLRGASSILGNNDPITVVDGVRIYASQSDARNNNLAPSLTGGSGGNTTATSDGMHTYTEYAAPSPLDQIDPSSIETIEVLKGPSATAIYGSDAANGVIIITTKHGRAGPTHWDLTLGQGVNWLPGTWPTNYYRFGNNPELNNPLPVFCPWSDPLCHVDSVVAFQALNDPRYTVFAHGSDQTASLTVSGGVPNVTYSLTGSGAGNLGALKLPAFEVQRYDSAYGPIPSDLVRPDKYTTYGVNGTLTVQPTPSMHVTLQSSLLNSTQQRSSLEGGITQLEGEYINNLGQTTVIASNLCCSNTPLIKNDVEQATAGSITATNALSFQWQLKPWLPLTATAGLNTMQRNDQTYIPYGVNNESPGILAFGTDTTGSYGVGRGTSQDKTLTVGTSIPLPHVLLALGGNAYTESTADLSAYTNQLAPGVSTPTQFPTSTCGTTVIGCSSFGQTTTNASTFGWYVEPRLNVSSRFFAAPGFRLDGGSGGTHSTVNQSGISSGGLVAFPKIDLSYVAVDQSHPRGLLTLLRPRLAFGLAGTQPGPEQKLRLLNGSIAGATVESLNDSTLVSIVALSTLGNTQLQPETSRELEGGIDAELWHGRVSMTWTQYNKTRYKAIIPIPLAPSVNATIPNIDQFDSRQYVNIGTVVNTGTEITTTLQVLANRAVSWTISGNLSNDNNVLSKLAPGFAPNKTIGLVAGYPLFSEWTLPIIYFADANHNGVIEPNEIRYGDSLVYAGQQVPKYQLNLNTNLTLLNGRLSLNATFAYQNGLTQNNLSALNSGEFVLLPNTPGTPLATQAAVTAACPRTDITDPCSGGATDFGLIQTVNTFRFQDVSINYNVPKAVSTWFRVPRMTIAIQGSNLGIHTNYRGMDPDVNAFSTVSGGDETADLGQIPEPRTWWLKLSLGN